MLNAPDFFIIATATSFGVSMAILGWKRFFSAESWSIQRKLDALYGEIRTSNLFLREIEQAMKKKERAPAHAIIDQDGDGYSRIDALPK